MKLSGIDLNKFLKKPSSDIIIVLIFGSNQGLIEEYSQILLDKTISDKSDPLAFIKLSAACIAENPAALLDEMAVVSWSTQKRVILIDKASDKLTKTISQCLDTQIKDILIILNAESLAAKKSTLRALLESKPQAAVISCYNDDGQNMLIEQMLAPLALKIDNNARNWLIDRFGSNRTLFKSEIEKITLYANENSTISLDDVLAICGDGTDSTISQIVNAALTASSLEQYINRIGDTSPITIIRSLIRQLIQLHHALALINSGMSLEQSLLKLRPPIFFPLDKIFKGQIYYWNIKKINYGLEMLLIAEKNCKSSDIPPVPIMIRAVQAISLLAAKK